MGQVGQVRRSPQAVAGRQSDGDAARGKPQTLLDGDNLGSWSPAPEAPQGKPGTGTRLAPTLHGGPGARHAAQDGHRDSPPPTAGVSSPAEDAAGGQAHSRGQDVTAGRSPHRPLRPDTVGPEDQQPPSRRGRAHKAKAATRPRVRELDRGVEAALVCAGGPALQRIFPSKKP